MPALQVMWRRCHFIISIRLGWFAITGFLRGFFPLMSPISEDVFGDVTVLPFDLYRKNSDIITGRYGVQVACVSCAWVFSDDCWGEMVSCRMAEAVITLRGAATVGKPPYS